VSDTPSGSPIDAHPAAPGVIEPRLAKGFRDLFADQALARRQVIDTIRGVYERYGFSPLETPIVEHLDVLLGEAGPEEHESIFTVTNRDEETLGLRFDLTVPLARVVAQYPDLPRPYRRYQVGRAWRSDKPGPGRYREFTQFDIDAVGVPAGLADVEILAAVCDTLEALGVGEFRVRYSSRGVLNRLLAFAGIAPERATDVFRVLDKRDKVGPEKVRAELTSGYRDASGDVIRGLGLAEDQVDRIDDFLAIGGASREAVLAALGRLFADVPDAEAEIAHLAQISRRLHALGYGDDRVAVDLSIARGLAYYTGTVFETLLIDAPQYGSVCSGGRYDGLVERFLGEAVPAVGASLGVDRLLAALVELGRVKLQKSTARVLVATMDEALLDEYLAMAFELRRAGVPTDLYLGGAARLGKQVKYADRLGIPIVLLYGTQEHERQLVTLKDMAPGRELSATVTDRAAWQEVRPGQTEVPRAELVEAVRRLLAAIEGSAG
jgi:histidyl-tRNA synthetase